MKDNGTKPAGTAPADISITQNKEYNMLMNMSRLSVSKHLMDEHYTVIWANEYYFELIGYSKKEYERLFGNQCDRYFKDDIDAWNSIVETVTTAYTNKQRGYSTIARMRNKSGRMMWVKLMGAFTSEVINGLPVVYTVMADISDLMQTQREQSVTYNNIPGFIAKFKVLEDGFEFVEANDKFIRFFGVQSRYSLSDWQTEENGAILAETHARMRRREPVSFVARFRNKNGNAAWLQVNGDCTDRHGSEPEYLFVYIDCTEILEQRELLERTNQQLERLAFVDPVTGGRNRTSFEMDGGGAVRASLPGTYVLVWLNIQKFKLINDLFGVENGDRVLKFLYETIQARLEDGEYAARLAADSFNLLLRAAEKEELEARLNRIAADVNCFEMLRERKYVLSLTAGLYPIDAPELPLTHIQDRANTARRNIGHAAGGSLCACSFYSEQDRLKMLREKDMENRMRGALKTREFIVHLQPKQSLRNARIAGAEALVRWKASEVGLIPPNDFVPLFEKNGFIVELDLYVFEKVCEMLRKWMDNGVKVVPVSVNMSRAHLVDPHFLDRYEEIRQKYAVPPDLLEIELTETLVFESPHLLIRFIDRIRERGYGCSIDDFGSGYSSLNILKDINVDTLKLDRAFFSEGLAGSPRGRDVITAVIGLAKKLRMNTVAEGVEAPSQVDFLRGAACDMVQGYVFSKPVPVSEFERMAFGREIAEKEAEAG